MAWLALARQRAADRLHDLRLDRQHQHITVAGQLVIVGRSLDTELAAELVQLLAIAVTGQDLAGFEVLLQHAADQAGGHVAGANESDGRSGHLKSSFEGGVE